MRFLGRLVTMNADNGSIRAVCSDKMCLYVAGPTDYTFGEVMVTGSWIDDGTLNAEAPFKVSGKDLKLISTNSHGRLYEMPSIPDHKYIDPGSVSATVVLRPH